VSPWPRPLDSYGLKYNEKMAVATVDEMIVVRAGVVYAW
jgi:hypothetical protein